MNIVFTGQAGLRKFQSINSRLRPYILNHNREWLKATEAGDHAQASEIEKQLIGIVNLEELLDASQIRATSYRHKRKNWERSFHHMRKEWDKIRKRNPKYCILSMHATWQVMSHFHSPLSWSFVNTDYSESHLLLLEFLKNEFKPDYFVTLIDDVYSVQKRIDKYHFRLIELLRWRDIEMVTTDMLANLAVERERHIGADHFPFEKSPIFAIKQPVKTIFQYFSDPDRPRVYLSYPISRPQKLLRNEGSVEAIEEINRFRKYFLDAFVAFDPITINERPLRDILAEHDKNAGRNSFWSFVSPILRLKSKTATLAIEREQNWSIDWDQTFGHLFPAVSNQIPVDEVREVVTSHDDNPSEVDSQIRLRDYRLIDQSDCVIVYRPTYRREKWSEGTESEMIYASETQKPVFIISDEEIDGDLSSDGAFGKLIDVSRVFKRRNIYEAENQKLAFDEVKNQIAAVTRDYRSKRYR